MKKSEPQDPVISMQSNLCGMKDLKTGGLFSKAKSCCLAGSQLDVCVKTRTSLDININHAGDKQVKTKIRD